MIRVWPIILSFSYVTYTTTEHLARCTVIFLRVRVIQSSSSQSRREEKQRNVTVKAPCDFLAPTLGATKISTFDIMYVQMLQVDNIAMPFSRTIERRDRHETNKGR